MVADTQKMELDLEDMEAGREQGSQPLKVEWGKDNVAFLLMENREAAQAEEILVLLMEP